MLDADGRDLLSDFPPATLQPFEQQGGLYGLPLTISVPVLNGSDYLLDKAGLQLPANGITPMQLLVLAQQLTNGTGAQKQYGYASPGSLTKLLDWWLRAQDIALTSGSDAQPAFTEPASVEAIRAFVQLIRETSPHTRLLGAPDAPHGDTSVSLIGTQQVALWIAFPGDDAVAPFGGEIAQAPLLTRQGFSAADIAVTGVYLSASRNGSAACWRFVTALSEQPPNVGGDPGGILTIPARRSVASDPTFLATLAPAQRTLVEVTSQQMATPLPSSSDAEIPRRWLYKAVDRAIQGGNLEEELASAQESTLQHLSCVQSGEKLEVCLRQVGG